jgi:transcription antitermination factor NusG
MSIINTTHHWFALQTRPKNERKTENLLKQKGYECFTPMYRSRRKWSDRTVETDLPLFPGYVFCRSGPLVLGKAISTEGVIRIVGFGGRPAEIAIEEIEALQLLALSDVLREPWKYLPIGTRVRVETGPLAGAIGGVCMDGNKRRLIISVTLLQRSVAIQLDEDIVISVMANQIESSAGFKSKSYLAVKLVQRV